MSTTYTPKEVKEIIDEYREKLGPIRIGCKKCGAKMIYPDFYYTQSDKGVPKCQNCGAKLKLDKLERRIDEANEELIQWLKERQSKKTL